MTRYSDLIAHFQALIEKKGDQPFARHDGPCTCGFFFEQVTQQNRNLNKAIHRKNRIIARLRKELAEAKSKDCLTLDPGNASVETLKNLMIAISELNIARGGKGCEFTAVDGKVIGKPI